MRTEKAFEKEVLLVNSDLTAADHLIDELDTVIQDTGNLELSKTLNDISDSYQAIRALLNSNLQS